VETESRLLQLEFDLQDAPLRCIQGERGPGKEPDALGFLPAGPLVMLYATVLAIAAFVWSVRLWVSRSIVGAWAVVFQPLPYLAGVHWLEVIVYDLTWIFAVIGIAGMMVFGNAVSMEALMRQELAQQLPQQEQGAPVCREMLEEMERATMGKRQGSGALFAFYAFNLVRVALFFPTTGMMLFERNVCGFYVTALSGSSVSIAGLRQAPTLCSAADAWGMFFMLVICALDLYFLRLVYKLWLHLHQQCALSTYALIAPFNAPPLSYGAAEPPSPPKQAEAEDEDALCPGALLLPANFVVPLDSIRKLSAGIYPVAVLSASGQPLLHARLPSTPAQGGASLASFGLPWLELCATPKTRHPQASVGPLPRGGRMRRAAEIRGRAGEFYGHLEPQKSGWKVRRKGRTLLAISPMSLRGLEISASLPDGRVIASASAADNENLRVHVDAGGDTLLVLMCAMAVVLMSPRPPMLLVKPPSGAPITDPIVYQ